MVGRLADDVCVGVKSNCVEITVNRTHAFIEKTWELLITDMDLGRIDSSHKRSRGYTPIRRHHYVSLEMRRKPE